MLHRLFAPPLLAPGIVLLCAACALAQSPGRDGETRTPVKPSTERTLVLPETPYRYADLELPAHFRTLSAFYGSAAEPLAAAGFAIPRVELLTGSATRRRKEAVYLALRDGAVDVLVGTHAVIQEGVEPLGLALSVVDEQHRFGVRQRLELRDKGQNPHLLVMTATPIPRSLGLTLYGDLDLSVIDQLPVNRGRIRTHVRSRDQLPKVWQFVKAQLAEGRQAKVSRCAQAVPSGTKRLRNSAAVIDPAKGELPALPRSAMSVSSRSA